MNARHTDSQARRGPSKALDLMMQDAHEADCRDCDDSLLRDYQDLCDVRTVLLRRNRPIDVECRLTVFRQKMLQGKGRRHPARRPAIIGMLVTAAAVIAALAIIHLPSLSPSRPGPRAVTPNGQPACTLSSEGQASRVFTAKTNHLTIPPEAYMLKNAPAKEQLLTVPYGCSADIALPDGSMAYVHTGSTLSFSPHYINGKRVVILEGEAYFKVRHDSRHPFIVHANSVMTTVYGTEFNVRTEGQHAASVTLISGSVGISSPHCSRLLAPGQQAAVTDKGATVQNVDLLPFTNWRDGYLYYDRVPLETIVTDLAHNYNLDVRFDNNDTRSKLTHFVCERGADIHTVISMLNEMQKVRVRLEDKTLVVG